jgi:hypothetical protein
MMALTEAWSLENTDEDSDDQVSALFGHTGPMLWSEATVRAYEELNHPAQLRCYGSRLATFSGVASLTLKYRKLNLGQRSKGKEMKPSACQKRQAYQKTMSEVLNGSYIPMLLTTIVAYQSLTIPLDKLRIKPSAQWKLGVEMKQFILSCLPQTLDHAVRMQDGVRVLAPSSSSTSQCLFDSIIFKLLYLCAERPAGDAKGQL